MSIWDTLVEGLAEETEDTYNSPTQEDWDWYMENTYVDPAERVW